MSEKLGTVPTSCWALSEKFRIVSTVRSAVVVKLNGPSVGAPLQPDSIGEGFGYFLGKYLLPKKLLQGTLPSSPHHHHHQSPGANHHIINHHPVCTHPRHNITNATMPRSSCLFHGSLCAVRTQCSSYFSAKALRSSAPPLV